jgi:hypothetical protein
MKGENYSGERQFRHSRGGSGGLDVGWLTRGALPFAGTAAPAWRAARTAKR